MGVFCTLDTGRPSRRLARLFSGCLRLWFMLLSILALPQFGMLDDEPKQAQDASRRREPALFPISQRRHGGRCALQRPPGSDRTSPSPGAPESALASLRALAPSSLPTEPDADQAVIRRHRPQWPPPLALSQRRFSSWPCHTTILISPESMLACQALAYTATSHTTFCSVRLKQITRAPLDLPDPARLQRTWRAPSAPGITSPVNGFAAIQSMDARRSFSD